MCCSACCGDDDDDGDMEGKSANVAVVLSLVVTAAWIESAFSEEFVLNEERKRVIIIGVRK